MNSIKKLSLAIRTGLFTASTGNNRSSPGGNLSGDTQSPTRNVNKSWAYLPALLMGLGLIAGSNSAHATSWQYLGSSTGYNHSTGLPGALTSMSSTMPTGLLTTVLNRLPEGQGIGKNPTALAQLTNDAGANLFLKAAANVKVSYVTEGAGYENSVGFFKFPKANLTTMVKTDVLDTILFPNFSDTVLQFGKAVDLGQFAANDAIGFTIVANGWQTVANNAGTHPGVVDPNKAASKIFRTIKRFNPEPADTNNLQAHTILFAYPEKELMVLAFEDLNRQSGANNDFGYTSDNDFNDVIIAIHVSPWSAVDCTNCNLLVTTPVTPAPTANCKIPLTTTPIPPSALTNKGKKVNICHFPPGNTANVQQINISTSALSTHLTHHDDAFQINGVCPPLVCPPPPPTCTSPQVLQNGSCVTPPPTCTSPQVLQNGSCVTPPPTCTSPQVLQNGSCVTPTITCTSPQVLQNGACVDPTITCTSPQVLQNGACITPVTCTSPKVLQNNACVDPTCTPPEVLKNGRCATPLTGESGPISWREITAPTGTVDDNKAARASAKTARDAALAAKLQCLAEEKITNTGRNCNAL